MYIFVCSPGRSGTKYISEIFKNYTNIKSFHGGEDKLRTIIDNGAYKNNNKLYLINRLKLIKKLHDNGEGYFESNQIFIHYLVNGILDKTNNIDLRPLYVINLVRNPLEVAVSYENRKSYPSNYNNKWRQPIYNNNNRLLNIKTQKQIKKDELHDNITIFQENLIDWIDTQMKFEKYKNMFDNDELIKLFKHFNIKYKIKANIKLSKNKNKLKTIIKDKHIKETKELINMLKQLDNYPENIINKYFKDYI
jgi:hypothetical protein